MQLNRLATAIVTGVVVVLTALGTGAAFATTTSTPTAHIQAHGAHGHDGGDGGDDGTDSTGGTDW